MLVLKDLGVKTLSILKVRNILLMKYVYILRYWRMRNNSATKKDKESKAELSDNKAM
jgi:hypothetical protein